VGTGIAAAAFEIVDALLVQDERIAERVAPALT
jgi:hypothetical protein